MKIAKSFLVFTFSFIFSFIFSLFFTFKVFAGWELESGLASPPVGSKGQLSTSVSKLIFKNKKQIKEYVPDELPYGIVEDEKVTLNKKTYFVTTWASGSDNVLLRVFEPETKGAEPLCEVNSFTPNPKAALRLTKKNGVQILVRPAVGVNPTWERCQ